MTKPVRKVKSNGRTITGTFSSPKTGKLIQFESYLEYAFIEIFEFDSQAIDIFDQPVTIQYQHKTMTCKHTPDFLVHYNNRRPVIFEVKYQSEIDTDDGSIARNFKAGRSYAKDNNSDYRIITDQQILTVYLHNVDELLKVRSENPNLVYTSRLIAALAKLKVSTPNQLVNSLTSDLDERAVFVRQLRILMFKRTISFDMFSSKLKGSTTIKLARKNSFKELNYPYKYAQARKG